MLTKDVQGQDDKDAAEVEEDSPARQALEFQNDRLPQFLRALPRLLLPPLVVTLICLLAGQLSNLLFHTLAEVFSIVIALTALAVATTSHRFTRNHYTVHVAVAIGWCAALDIAHAVSYEGMRLLPTPDPDTPTQFWILARFIQAAALLISPLYLRRVARIGSLHAAYGLTAVLGALWILSGHFPQAYVVGQGLTPFKIYAEYVIIVMLLAAGALLWRDRALMSPRLHLSMQVALLLMVLSEFAFTRYVSLHGGANQFGHILKIFAYWFVYLALVQSTLREPFSMLARTAGTYDAVPDPVLVVGVDGRIHQANRAALRYAGLPARAVVGQAVHGLFHAAAVPVADCPVCARLARGDTHFVAEIDRGGDAGSVECTLAPFWEGEPGRGIVQVVRDITERKRQEGEREQLMGVLGERVKELRCLHHVSRLLEQPVLDVPQLLTELVRLLPAAFQSADRARAGIVGDWGSFGDAAALSASCRVVRELRVNNQVVARIAVGYPDDPRSEREAFLPEETALLSTVAQRVGEAIQRSRAEGQVRRLSYLYDMLSATNRAIVRCTDEQELLRQVYAALIQHGAFPTLFIALSEQGRRPMRIIHTHGILASAQPWLQAVLDDPASLFGQHFPDFLAGRTIWLSLPPPGPADADWDIWLRTQDIRSRAVVPLLCEGRLYGVIGLYAPGVDAFDPSQLSLMDEMAADLAFALNGMAANRRRQEAEDRAELSELRFREVFESSPTPMQIQSVDTVAMLAMNRAHREWLGYELEEIRGKEDWFNKVYPDAQVREQLHDSWQQAVAQAQRLGGVVRSPELRLRCKDGSERIAQGTMTLVDGDAIVAWTDLTEIRRGEQALRASELHFRAMIEQTVMGVYVRRGGRFVYVNPRYCEMIGWSREELVGQEIWRFTTDDPENVRRIHAAWDALEAGQAAVHYSVPIRCKSGELRELALHGTRVQWDDGPATIVVAEDVTERQQAERQIADYVRQLEASMRGTLQAVSNMIDQRDPYTAGHERRVGLIAGAIGREMGWDARRCDTLEMVGLVHDIGKIGVPAEILTKPGRLTELEMQLVRQHAQTGYEILKDVPFPFPVAEIIRQHHERLDGSGYPRGLRGEDILPEARVLAVADVIESIASHRPYRPARGLGVALEELGRGRGTHYDAQVVDAFERLLRDKGYTLPQ
jgi:PAS domain S-box-containing protein